MALYSDPFRQQAHDDNNDDPSWSHQCLCGGCDGTVRFYDADGVGVCSVCDHEWIQTDCVVCEGRTNPWPDQPNVYCGACDGHGVTIRPHGWGTPRLTNE